MSRDLTPNEVVIVMGEMSALSLDSRDVARYKDIIDKYANIIGCFVMPGVDTVDLALPNLNEEERERVKGAMLRLTLEAMRMVDSTIGLE
jgi:hypothetical protein